MELVSTKKMMYDFMPAHHSIVDHLQIACSRFEFPPALCWVQTSKEPTQVEPKWFDFPVITDEAFMVHHDTCNPTYVEGGLPKPFLPFTGGNTSNGEARYKENGQRSDRYGG